MTIFECNKEVVLRINGLDHVLIVPEIKVTPLPYTGGASSVIRLIDGSRKPVQVEWDIEIELIFGNFYDPIELASFRDVLRLSYLDPLNTTYFFIIGDTYNAAAIEVIPEVMDGMTNYATTEGIRNRVGILKFVNKIPLVEIPYWIENDALSV